MTRTSRQTGGPLPTSLENAAVRDGCLECEAWQARKIANSDGAASRSATEGAAPASAAPEGRQPSIRERAFDAAQRLVLSQPHMAIGQLEQNRMADYILELAARFEAWMIAKPAPDLRTLDACMSGWDAAVDDACMSSFDGSVYAWEGAPPVAAQPKDQATAAEVSGPPERFNEIAVRHIDPAAADPVRMESTLVAMAQHVHSQIHAFQTAANRMYRR